MSGMIAVVIPVSAVHEHHQQRAQQQKRVGQKPKNVGGMFGNQVESGDQEKDEENLP